MFRIVVTSYTTLQTDGPHRAAYAEAGCELVPGPFIRWSTEEELLESVTDCDAVLCTTDQFTERVFAAAPRLKIVSRFGVGYDTIDVEAATKHGVWVTITPGVNHLAVADHTLALLLAVARQVVPLANMVEAGGWDRPPGGRAGRQDAGDRRLREYRPPGGAPRRRVRDADYRARHHGGTPPPLLLSA